MRSTKYQLASLAFAATLLFGGCNYGKGDPAAEAPPPAQVEREQDGSVIRVDHPEQFPLAAAVEHKAAPTLNVPRSAASERRMGPSAACVTAPHQSVARQKTANADVT